MTVKPKASDRERRATHRLRGPEGGPRHNGQKGHECANGAPATTPKRWSAAARQDAEDFEDPLDGVDDAVVDAPAAAPSVLGGFSPLPLLR